ncbi:hypothetical protein EST38_g5299 [Candolleomyces aberdarensis]|uniref:Kinesin-like protein n=1 Tax=Candolleomyces aberdarensis TaxID=2316362 RepID=A0A4Q2DKU3_9AGAR|nr:hypothetical protein EST38_g5299 [Candolleomyces aberdarensis]
MASHKVKIAARLRPRLDGEVVDDNIKVFHNSDASTGSTNSTSGASYISVVNPRDTTQVFKFPFSNCYDENSTQEEIFHNDVEPLIDVVYSGITVTIFAYGVTSSGKTHTMQGTKVQPGVIPRVVQAMFEKKTHLTQHEVNLTVSYMEIYKDEVYDLFVTRENAPKLPVRENDVGMVFVANLSSQSISSVEEFDSLYQQATRNRSVGATNLNRQSSRSHAVLTVEATMIDHSNNTTLTGKINLVDLAGSENNKQTGNDSTRMAESSAINKSLSVLGQVVHALNQGASRIPYRNSKLTRILQDALGGNAVGLLICNLAPGTKFRQDTLNTLNFAVRTKNVENKPVINERDNRPAPKAHFSAPSNPPPIGKPAPAVLIPVSTTGTGSGAGPTRSRASLVPVVSRVPRVSMGANQYQPFALAGVGGGGRRLTSIGEAQPERPGLTEKDIDERISRAVEAEVARRLAEKEKEWQEEQKRQQAELEARAAAAAAEAEERRRSRTPEKDMSLPSGVLTPILKKHRDLDDELKQRLLELEKKFERGNKETQLADVLSPVSKKKTGRAYVALARAHSEKGDLNVALELYRKAESYVPDNMKLKERIIEIEWAVKNGREYVPSPKPQKQHKKHKKNRSNKASTASSSHEDQENEAMDMDISGGAGNGGVKGKTRIMSPTSEFGVELTNAGETGVPGGNTSLTKRPFADTEDDQEVDSGIDHGHGMIATQTPPPPQQQQKRQKRDFIKNEEDHYHDDLNERWEPPYAPNPKVRELNEEIGL